MKIVIEIPEKEFGIDIDGKFKDFFYRLRAEINIHLTTNTNLVCGAYELETIDMFLDAFDNAIPLPKGHGRLIDANNITFSQFFDAGDYAQARRGIYEAPTIIEADKGSDSE